MDTQPINCSSSLLHHHCTARANTARLHTAVMWRAVARSISWGLAPFRFRAVSVKAFHIRLQMSSSGSTLTCRPTSERLRGFGSMHGAARSSLQRRAPSLAPIMPLRRTQQEAGSSGTHTRHARVHAHAHTHHVLPRDMSILGRRTIHRASPQPPIAALHAPCPASTQPATP